RSIDKIGRVRCPVLIMHGKSDYVIPFHHGVQLYNAVKTPKLHFWVNAVGHNDFPSASDGEYQEKIYEFIHLLETNQR
ncbi:MAG TPA: alpha/beta hydrolase, partial [Armatimonadota bacterium]|nr:alpha/beta hydrolase [Armatimonadota bacterium]